MADAGELALSNQPVVIDNGSSTLKAGFAGADAPRVVFNSAVGRPKHPRAMPGGALEGGSSFVGRQVAEHRGLFRLSWPMEGGVVRDWADMEKVWGHVMKELDVSSEEHPVLMTEAPLNPYANRQRAAEVLFETFQVPAVFFALTAVLSLYASGRTTGLVVDSGDGSSHCVPVYQGFAMPHAITRSDVAGRAVTNHLKLLLRRGCGYSATTSAELDIVRSIKEEVVYCAFNPAKEEQQHAASAATATSYRLPDGTTLSIGAERFRAPEILFNPAMIGSEEPGLPQLATTAVMRCDVDLRRALFKEIVLAGGSTLMPGFGDRMLNAVRKLAPRDSHIRIVASPERQFSAWIGGSILASLATFKSMWVRKAEYEEAGASVLHEKSL